jgi:pimeloyl-ACP methyl ester carboxylesterase
VVANGSTACPSRHAGRGLPVRAPAIKHQIAGADLEVVTVGDGPVVGYLHGILGTPPELPFLSALARRGHRVIAPNLPGFGRSEPLPCRTFFDWVGHLSESLDVCGLTGGSMVASSVGAMVAMELAALRPEAFEQLVLIAPLGLWLDNHPLHDVWSERVPRQPEWLVSDPDVLAPFEVSDPDADQDTLLEDTVRRYRTRSSAASIMWPGPDRDLAERLHRVRCPVHLLWGADDRLADATEYSEAWKTALPNLGRHQFIGGAGHLAEWDAPEAVATAVVEYLG